MTKTENEIKKDFRQKVKKAGYRVTIKEYDNTLRFLPKESSSYLREYKWKFVEGFLILNDTCDNKNNHIGTELSETFDSLVCQYLIEIGKLNKCHTLLITTMVENGELIKPFQSSYDLEETNPVLMEDLKQTTHITSSSYYMYQLDQDKFRTFVERSKAIVEAMDQIFSKEVTWNYSINRYYTFIRLRSFEFVFNGFPGEMEIKQDGDRFRLQIKEEGYKGSMLIDVKVGSDELSKAIEEGFEKINQKIRIKNTLNPPRFYFDQMFKAINGQIMHSLDPYKEELYHYLVDQHGHGKTEELSMDKRQLDVFQTNLNVGPGYELKQFELFDHSFLVATMRNIEKFAFLPDYRNGEQLKGLLRSLFKKPFQDYKDDYRLLSKKLEEMRHFDKKEEVTDTKEDVWKNPWFEMSLKRKNENIKYKVASFNGVHILKQKDWYQSPFGPKKIINSVYDDLETLEESLIEKINDLIQKKD